MNQETLLAKYLRGELTETEQREFDVLLREDADFKAEVNFQLDVQRAIEAEEDNDFRTILGDFELEARAGDSNIISAESAKTKFPTKWLVAASIALIAGFAYFFGFNQSNSAQELFAQNFKPYRNVTHPITRGEESVDLKTKTFSAYAKGNYKEAVPLFTELYATEKEAYSLFYKANALLQIGRAEEAVPLLQEHLSTADSLTDKSNWYLAMAYLQLNDTAKAKEALKKVVENNTYKAEEARQLLDTL